MNDIDDALRFAVVVSVVRAATVPAVLLDVVPQVPILYEVLQVGLEALALIGSVPILFMVSAELALVPGGGFAFHWLLPLEEGLRLYFADELIDWLLEDRVNGSVDWGFASGRPASP